MRKEKKEKEGLVTRRKTRKNSGHLTAGRTGPDGNQSLPKPSEDTSRFLDTLILKDKSLLDCNEYLIVPEFYFDNYEMLEKVIELAPDIEKQGDTIGEILANALRELEVRAFAKWRIDGLDICLRDDAINFYLPYEGMDTMFSYSLISLYYIEKKHSWIMPYIFTILYHLEEVNKVPFPDFSEGEEASAIESMVCTDGDEDCEIEAYSEGIKKEYKKLQDRIQKEKLPFEEYCKFNHLTPNIKAAHKLLEIGKKLLLLKVDFYDFIHHPERDHYGVDPRVHHRFFWNMDGDDTLFQYLASGYDADWGESGSTGFYKPISFNQKGPPISSEDFPILLHNFLDKLWDLTHECTPKKKKK